MKTLSYDENISFMSGEAGIGKLLKEWDSN